MHRERDEGCSCLIHNDGSATSDYLVAVLRIKDRFKGFQIWRPSLMHFEDGDGPEVVLIFRFLLHINEKIPNALTAQITLVDILIRA